MSRRRQLHLLEKSRVDHKCLADHVEATSGGPKSLEQTFSPADAVQDTPVPTPSSVGRAVTQQSHNQKLLANSVSSFVASFSSVALSAPNHNKSLVLQLPFCCSLPAAAAIALFWPFIR